MAEYEDDDNSVVSCVTFDEIEGGGKGKGKGLEYRRMRIWSEEDEYLLFQLVADYKNTTGLEPFAANSTSSPFMDFLRENDNNGALNNMTKEQVYNKIRSGKGKLRNYYLKNKNNNAPRFPTPNRRKLFHLLKTIWPMEDKKKKKIISPPAAADEEKMPLSVLEQWAVEGLRHVKSPERRLQLETKLKKCKLQYAKAQFRYLRLVTYVTSLAANKDN